MNVKRCQMHECAESAEREVITIRWGKIGCYCLPDARKTLQQNEDAVLLMPLGWHRRNVKVMKETDRRIKRRARWVSVRVAAMKRRAAQS